MERVEKIDEEEFIVRQGPGECVLEVVNGDDIGQVTYFPKNPPFYGHFNGFGRYADSIESAVAAAARQILATRKGISQKEACEAMGEYLKG